MNFHVVEYLFEALIDTHWVFYSSCLKKLGWEKKEECLLIKDTGVVIAL